MSSLVKFQEMGCIAKAFKESGMFPDIKSEAQAIVKIQAGAELGVEPFAAMQGIDIIQGKPRMSSSLQAALIKRSGKYTFKTLLHDDQVCKLEFFEIRGEQVTSLGFSEFTIKEAELAGLTGKDNWRKHRKNMLFARALSNGAKWYCADVFIMSVYNESDEFDYQPQVAVDNSGIEALKIKGEVIDDSKSASVETDIKPTEEVEARSTEVSISIPAVVPAVTETIVKPVATQEDIKVILNAITECKTKAELDEVRETYRGVYKFTNTQIAAMKKTAETKEKELNNNG